MKQNLRLSPQARMPHAAALLCILVSFGTLSSLQAQIWDGGGAVVQWSNPDNWVGNVAPVANDSLTFAGAVQLSTSNDYVAGTQFNGITAAAGAGAFVLAGNSINLGGNVTNLSSSTLSISLPMALLQDTTFNASAGAITVTGGISGIGFDLVKTGVNTLTLGTVLNTYTGETKLRQGTLALSFASAPVAATDLISSSSALELGGGPSSVSLSTTSRNSAASTNSQTFNGTTIKAGSSTITVARGGTSAGNTMTLDLGSLTREAGGVLNVVQGANATFGTNAWLKASSSLSNDILGGWATIGNDWATISGADVVAYSAYTTPLTTAPTITSAAATNLQITNTNAKTPPTGVTNTSGTALITMDDTTGLASGDSVSGTGIRPGTTIVSVDSATEITVSANTTAAVTAISAYAPVQMAAAGVTNVNTLQVTDSANRIVNIGSGNTLRLGQYGGVWRTSTAAASLTLTGGTLTAGGVDDAAGEIVFNAAGLGDALNNVNFGIVVDSQITNNGLGAVTLVKMGNQVLSLTNAGNSYTGGTFVHQGRLHSTQAGNLGSGDVTIASGSGVVLAGAGDYTNDFFVSGVGQSSRSSTSDSTNGSHGAILLNNGANLTGMVALVGNTRIAATPFYGVGASGTGTISGRITGDSNLEFGYNLNIASGAGTITISNTDNDWTGGTTISGGGSSGNRTMTLVLGNSEVIPHGVGFGDVNFNKGGTSGGVNLNLNGFSETINGLNSSGTGGITLRNSTSAAATATLTVGAADANGVYAGTIVNGHASALLNIAKIGAGTQELAGSNTYTGTTTVGAGKLLLSGTLTGTSLVTVNGGTFEYTNATAGLNRAVTANSGGTFRYNTTQAYTGALTMAGGSVAGSGNLGATVLGGTGSVDPGNSPGILTAAVFNGSGGLGANFEFTEVGDPDWDITDASVNDVLRLTQTTGDGPFDAVNLTGSNSIGIYLNVATLVEGDSFKGGFFTDQSADFLTSIAGANYAYFVMGDGLGTDVTYNSQGYYTLSNFDPLLLVNVGTAQIASADFAAGTVTNGYVSTFTVAVIPEPASLVLLLVSGIALLALRRRR